MIAFAPTGVAEDTMMDSSNARPQEASSSPTGGDSASKGKEDSFDTNNQVEGVDEADIVKSDGSKFLLPQNVPHFTSLLVPDMHFCFSPSA